MLPASRRRHTRWMGRAARLRCGWRIRRAARWRRTWIRCACRRRGTWRTGSTERMRHASRRLRARVGSRGNHSMGLNGAGRRRIHAGRVNGLANLARDLSRRRSSVPARAAIAHVVRDGGRGTECGVVALDRYRVVVDVVHHQVAGLNEAPVGVVRLDHYRAARWRKGRPAHVPAAVSPGDPGRCPDGARHPDPSVAAVEIPAPVVERRPTPTPVAFERPTVIGINPVPSRTVGSKARAHDGGVRPPHPTVAAQVDPFTVRGQRAVEDLHRCNRAAACPGRDRLRRRRAGREKRPRPQRCLALQANLQPSRRSGLQRWPRP
jgi:hypothetical protein